MSPRVRRLRRGIAWMIVSSLPVAAPMQAFPEPVSSDPVAYIEQIIPPDAKLDDVATISRDKKLLHFSGRQKFLQSGDEINITRTGAVVIVRRIATNQPVAVGAGSVPLPYIVPKSSVPGIGGQLLSWFAALLTNANQAGDGSAMVASRAIQGTCYNTTGETNQPVEFRIPILTASRSLLAAGKRAIFVSWQGGAPPFSLTLAAVDTDRTVAEVTGIRDSCAAFLPRVELRPGRYRLTLTDANNVKEQEDSLFVVDKAPAEPRELRDANLPEEAHKIYAATWLTAQDRGIWAFEAQQRVAAMDCRSPAVVDWLRQWGGSSPCVDSAR